jgi:hypothetical protein
VGSKIELTVGLKRIEINKLLGGEPSLVGPNGQIRVFLS